MNVPSTDDRPHLAVVLVCVATLAFVSMNACVKMLSQTLGVVEIIWGRYFFHLLASAVMFPATVIALRTSRRKDLQILRSFLVLGATTFAFIALRHIPLATMTAIGFVGPMIVVALAAFLLKEKVSAQRWGAVATGFAGVLIIVRPGLTGTDWASLLPVAMATCYACYQILTRVLRGLASAKTTLFYSALVGTIASTLLVPFHWATPEPREWMLMVASGVLGGLGHLALIKAYEWAPASLAAPFVYSELIWASGIGWVLFGHFPDLWTWLGAGILMVTGVYLLRQG